LRSWFASRPAYCREYGQNRFQSAKIGQLERARSPAKIGAKQAIANHELEQISETPRAARRAMTHGYYRPGWKFYEVIWEREGGRLATAALHAADEANLFSVAFSNPMRNWSFVRRIKASSLQAR
jgi:hypothetical protein